MDDEAVLRVRLTPRGGRDSLDSWSENTLRARVAAAPVDGAANKALIALLSDRLNVPKSRIAIRTGETSRDKTLAISGLSPDELTARLINAITKR